MRDQIGTSLLSALEDDQLFPNVILQDKPIEPRKLMELIREMLMANDGIV
jgi:hypothetical protein